MWGVWRCSSDGSLLVLLGFTSQTNRPHRLIMELAAAPGAVPGGRCELPELRVPALAAGSNGSSRATAAPVSGTPAKAVAAAAAVASASAASGTPASSPSYQATACWYVPARRPHHPARQHSPTLPRLDSLPCPPTTDPIPPLPLPPLCSSQPTRRLATFYRAWSSSPDLLLVQWTLTGDEDSSSPGDWQTHRSGAAPSPAPASPIAASGSPEQPPALLGLVQPGAPSLTCWRRPPSTAAGAAGGEHEDKSDAAATGSLSRLQMALAERKIKDKRRGDGSGRTQPVDAQRTDVRLWMSMAELRACCGPLHALVSANLPAAAAAAGASPASASAATGPGRESQAEPMPTSQSAATPTPPSGAAVASSPSPSSSAVPAAPGSSTPPASQPLLSNHLHQIVSFCRSNSQQLVGPLLNVLLVYGSMSGLSEAFRHREVVHFLADQLAGAASTALTAAGSSAAGGRPVSSAAGGSAGPTADDMLGVLGEQDPVICADILRQLLADQQATATADTASSPKDKGSAAATDQLRIIHLFHMAFGRPGAGAPVLFPHSHFPLTALDDIVAALKQLLGAAEVAGTGPAGAAEHLARLSAQVDSLALRLLRMWKPLLATPPATSLDAAAAAAAAIRDRPGDSQSAEQAWLAAFGQHTPHVTFALPRTPSNRSGGPPEAAVGTIAVGSPVWRGWVVVAEPRPKGAPPALRLQHLSSLFLFRHPSRPAAVLCAAVDPLPSPTYVPSGTSNNFVPCGMFAAESPTSVSR